MNLYKQCKDHPLSVLMAGSVFLLFGILSLSELDMEELPETDSTVITVISELPGYPAKEIESLITVPMENVLSGIKDIRNMDSVSGRGLSRIELSFDWGADMYKSSISVRECIDGLYPYLPGGMDKPLVLSRDRYGDPVIQLALKAVNVRDDTDYYSILKGSIKHRLQSLDEIAFVSISGLNKPELHVELDMEALAARGLSIGETSSALSSFFVSKTAGKIMDNGKQRLITVESGINTISGIEELQLFPGVKLLDIAEIKMGSEIKDSLYLLNAEEAWEMSIYKSASSDNIEAAEAVKKILPLLKNEYSGMIEFQIVTDESIRIRKNIISLLYSLFCGVGGAFLFLLLLYKKFYAALITTLTIPVTLILNFFFLFIFNISLNTLSLYGMIAAAGLIADNSIIVFHELKNGEELNKITSTLFTSTITTIIVFLPPLFIQGPTSVLFRDLVLTVILTVAISLPVSLFITPACFRLIHNKKTEQSILKKTGSSKEDLQKLQSLYGKILEQIIHSQNKRGKTVFFFILIILTSLLFLKFIPFELFPDRQSHNMHLSLFLTGNFNTQEIKNRGIKISEKILEEFKAKTIIIKSADSEDGEASVNGSAGMEMNQLNILISFENPLKPETKENIHQYCLNTLHLYNCVLEPLPGSFKNYFPDAESLSLESSDSDALYSFPLPPGTIDINGRDRDYYFFKTDFKRLNALNITPLSIHSELSAFVEGISAGEVEIGKEKINILVRAAEKYRSDINSLNRSGLINKAAPLHLLGEFAKSSSRDLLFRKNQKYIRTITTIGNGDYQPTNDIQDFSLAPDIFFHKYEQTDMHHLIYLYALSLVLLFLTLGVQTGSLRKTIILFSTLAPGIWGGFLFLILFRQTLNIYGFLGLLILQGTIVNSGILLLASMDDSIECGLSIKQGALRVLPTIIGSCFSTVTALIPVLIFSLQSGNGEAGMAISLIGGLLIGSIMILTLIPLLYRVLVPVHGQ